MKSGEGREVKSGASRKTGRNKDMSKGKKLRKKQGESTLKYILSHCRHDLFAMGFPHTSHAVELLIEMLTN